MNELLLIYKTYLRYVSFVGSQKVAGYTEDKLNALQATFLHSLNKFRRCKFCPQTGFNRLNNVLQKLD